jgi:RNA polymerase primary sigma factor
MAFDVTIREYLREIDESPLLTQEEERRLCRRIVDRSDQQARERLVRSNLRLVVNIAKGFGGRGVSLGDLIEEGNLGLIKAVDYFDPDRGTRFSTYAAWWIKQGIKRSLLENTRPLHIPSYMIGLITQWRHTAAYLENLLGRKPDDDELAHAMELPPRKAKFVGRIVRILGSVKDVYSSDQQDDGDQAETVLPDDQTQRPEDEWAASEQLQKVLGLLDHQLDSRQAEVLRLYYGIGGRKAMTFKQIGARLGLTRERIRQIQREALTRLYEYMEGPG